MIILSADPGTKNFAFAITEHKSSKGKIKSKIIATGMLTDVLILDLKDDVAAKVMRFEKALIELRERYSPDYVFFERFQSRGLKGTTIECINIMLAIMIRVFRKQKPILLLASTWKNRIGKKVDLKSSYKDFGLTRKHSPKTPHELDATLIGFYGMCRIQGIPDFDYFHVGNWDRFIEWFLTRPSLF